MCIAVGGLSFWGSGQLDKVIPLDAHLADDQEWAAEAFPAVDNVPSITRMAELCSRWIDFTR